MKSFNLFQKKFVSIFAVFVFVFILGTAPQSVSAAEKSTAKSSGIHLDYATVCGNRGYHLMKPIGVGVIQTTSGQKYYGQAWQCDGCGIAMVTEGNPTYALPQKIGHYATWQADGAITTNTLVIRTNSVGYTAGTTLGGYHFQ